ncbi:MAG: hypothetical protein ABH803_02570 [Candidatus Micrarchaeota archaeon]
MTIPFLDEVLRKQGAGVWSFMPPAKEFKRKNNTANLNRVSMDSLWRVGTRAELVNNYNALMKKTYKKIAFSIVFLFASFYLYDFYSSTGAIEFILVTGLTAALAVHYWINAWGGYAGDWTDYEHDPVKMLPHNAYVLNQGRGMI